MSNHDEFDIDEVFEELQRELLLQRIINYSLALVLGVFIGLLVK